jgi:hypothetical protein
MSSNTSTSSNLRLRPRQYPLQRSKASFSIEFAQHPPP